MAIFLIAYFSNLLSSERAPWVAPLVIVGVIALAAVVVMLIVLWRRFWKWLGFGKDGKKTGLDLLGFFVALSIPVAVFVVGSLFTASQARDSALRSYFDAMSTLITDKDADLVHSKRDSGVQVLARAQTFTVLRNLDAQRKRSILEFLYTSGLIDPNDLKVKLWGADLSGADLSEAFLPRANLVHVDLSGANLRGAELSYAELVNANLKGADLSKADLNGENLYHFGVEDPQKAEWAHAAHMSGADLSGADLSEATVTEEQLNSASSLKGAKMPNGSTHD